MKKVVIYNSDTCTFCRQAEAYLHEKNIEFEEKNIKDPDNRKELIGLGYRSVPVIKIEEEYILGFDKAVIDEKLGL